MRIDIDSARVRSVFAELREQSGFEESRALFEQGRLPVEMLQAMALRPDILRAFGMMGEGVYPGGLLERALKEKVILKTSRLNGCQFCVNAHQDIMKNLGLSQDRIHDLESTRNLTQREAMALRYAETVTRTYGRVTEEQFAELSTGFSDEEIVELTFLIGYINMLNMFNNALEVSYRDDYRDLGAGKGVQ